MSSAAASPAAEPLAEGEGEELFDLDSVGTTRSFSYDEATLLTPGRYTARSPMTSASFKKVFAENFPNLEGFPWANVCVRGGAVVDLLLARPVKDLDMFYYGLDSDEAVLKKEPNRLAAHVGAANAAVKADDAAKVKQHTARVMALTKEADTERPEVTALKTRKTASR